jgi:amino acid transporter
LLKFLIVPKFGNVAVGITVVGSMVLYLVVFFVIIFSRKRKGEDHVESDERGKILSLTATFGGAMMSYLAVFLFCAFTQWNLKQQGVESVSVETATHILNRLMGVVGFTFFGVRSIAVLILFGPK